MHQENITVEVFRDLHTRDMSTDVASDGIDHIRQITTGIEIVRTTKLLRIANDNADQVQPRKIRWPKFEADMNIVLTERPLFLPTDNELASSADSCSDAASPLGIAFNARGKKVAIVDVSSPDFPELIAAHEIGHMFNLKKNGKNWDASMHCVHETCVMYRTAGVVEFEQRVEQGKMRRLFESAGLREPDYRNVIVPRAEEFCDECIHQLDKTSHFIKLSKSGRYIPPEWL